MVRGRMREAGLDATIDGIGNILGKSRASGRKALSGSHLESQNHAGWLDGALGCVYALEAARAITRTPATRYLGVDVVVFCDEEGHFGSFLGSRSFTGVLEESDIDAATRHATGTPMREALRSRRLCRTARALLIEPARYEASSRRISSRATRWRAPSSRSASSRRSWRSGSTGSR